jgi:hypothetical protein
MVVGMLSLELCNRLNCRYAGAGLGTHRLWALPQRAECAPHQTGSLELAKGS